ncbi:hypothetical protein RB195_004470 [Necator americanus]|uniref:DUF7027 domain-containing protein n=1 Tax=Necator americanus TaxID=51031 RepID=A0ABR1BK80_NECAM
MDFDPNSEKWECCCCTLPSGLQILAASEMLIATIIAAIATHHVARDTESPTYFEVCLISMMILMAVTSTMLIVGIHRHDTRLIYPTLIARVLLIIFVQVFGVSTVVAPQHVNSRWDKKSKEEEEDEKEPNVALRLVMLVFAMLVITVLVFYCIYLVVRCLQYQKSYCRMKERRASLIHASMIDPDAGSRRASSLPGLP